MSQEDESRILKMYNGLSDSKYVVPLVKRASEIAPFLEVPNSLFKIVSDLANMEETLNYRINSKVL